LSLFQNITDKKLYEYIRITQTSDATSAFATSVQP